MRYREDFTTFMQKAVTKYNITVYCIGGDDLPETITLDYNYGMGIIGSFQKDYWKYLKATLGPESLYGDRPYAVELDLFVPSKYDLVFRKEC